MKIGKKVVAVVLLLPILCCSCVKEEQDKNQIVLRMAEVMPQEHPSAKASQYFAELVNERSNGRIYIEIYYDESLGNADSILEQTRYGGIAFCRVSALDVIEEVISLESTYKQYAYDNPDNLMTWLKTDEEQIENAFKEDNLMPLVWYYPDYRCFYNSTAIINDIDDFRNLKIKTAETNLMHSSMAKLAAVAVDVDKADMYRSLKTGYINAGEASFGEFVLSDYYGLVSYVTLTNYIAAPDIIVACDTCMESFSDEDRKLIKQCAEDTYDYQRSQMKAFQTQYIEKVQSEKDLFLESDNFSTQLKIFLNRNEEDN